MKIKFKAIILISVFFMPLIVAAQDSIIKRNGEVIECRVKEIGTSEIKYLIPEFNPDLLFSIAKDEVEKIVFSDGKVQTFGQDSPLSKSIEQNSHDLFLIQKKNALKIDFLGLVNNTLTLTYERCLKPGRSAEISLGAVGIGFAEKEDNASGILFRGGYKLVRSPDFYLEGMRYAHIMKGPYAKLEFDFASYRIEGHKDIWDPKEKYTLSKWALLVVLGNQWVFSDSFTLDLYSGIGVGRNNLENLDWTYPYGFSTLGKEFPMAFSFGLRFGFLFN
jgi:hypothetical protein